MAKKQATLCFHLIFKFLFMIIIKHLNLCLCLQHLSTGQEAKLWRGCLQQNALIQRGVSEWSSVCVPVRTHTHTQVLHTYIKTMYIRVCTTFTEVCMVTLFHCITLLHCSYLDFFKHPEAIYPNFSIPQWTDQNILSL